MTWLELYNAVCYRVWGLQTPPEGAQALLQGQYGIIATIHHNIQKWRNYWFMEALEQIAVTAGLDTYALTTNFKEIVKNGITWDIITGPSPALTQILPGDYTCFGIDETEYPEYYEIWGDQLIIKPIPKNDLTLNMRCYRYLPRPPAVFDATSDALTINGCDVIYNYAVAEISTIQEELSKAKIYKANGDAALLMLGEEDAVRRRSGINQIRCVNV